MAILVMAFLITACSVTHQYKKIENADYRSTHALKPGISLNEVRDLMAKSDDLSMRGDGFGNIWAIWFYNEKKAPYPTLDTVSTFLIPQHTRSHNE